MAGTHWRKILESDYLAGSDLDDGKGGFREVVLTIAKVKKEAVKDQNGKNEDCLVLYFKESKKPMICNVTNAKTIEKVTGTAYLEEWPGNQVLLGTEKIKAFGELWDALRIRPKRIRQKQKPTTPCADCGKVIEDARGVTAEQIAAATAKRYGVPICMGCDEIRKAEESLAAEVDEALEGGSEDGKANG